MLRLLAAAACCALLGGVVAGSTAPSPRETLERAAVELLPPGAAVGRIDYRPHCYDFVRPEPTPPCLSVHSPLPATRTRGREPCAGRSASAGA